MKLQNAIEQANLAVVPYMMAGDGGLDQLEKQMQLLSDAGATAIELGIPFSDPVADGPVIQKAGARALADNISLEQILDVLTMSKIEIPLVVMSYFNPIYHLGVEKFIELAKKTPVKGLIIPDLPYEHRDLILPHLENTDIALIPLISLTSPKERMKMIAKQAQGFIYAVTVNGTTGERAVFGDKIDENLTYLKTISPVPVLAGFGISNLEHVARFSAVCDGVIVGSKVVQLLHEGKHEELSEFINEASKTR
ncbi:tryptophan synthase subunit alpha [Listeria rocourtiae]|uniref:tryptophan synthase subunit alpha n=1 Tax=Listeria rocourtiae TaxID=647910 RepID=UPI001628F60C|nr:tryptophan synthase subunit alpha [Listeria rocourtiae]MBC1434333.1 tryptophan synthase subunit alpha [Listeria rocourtiae]